MNAHLVAMARSHYGYGHWNADYWFIGPEEGDAPISTIQQRQQRWAALGHLDLDDCRKFHETIEPKWHLLPPPLQPTWRRLMILLMAATNRPTHEGFLREYQKTKWGMRDGETCVIELSGLPAHSYVASKNQRQALFDDGQQEGIRAERIKHIQNKIIEEAPKLVVMYGCSEKKHWEMISQVKFINCTDFKVGQSFRAGQTVFAFTKHPVAFGPTDEQWIEFGTELRKLIGNLKGWPPSDGNK